MAESSSVGGRKILLWATEISSVGGRRFFAGRYCRRLLEVRCGCGRYRRRTLEGSLWTVGDCLEESSVDGGEYSSRSPVQENYILRAPDENIVQAIAAALLATCCRLMLWPRSGLFPFSTLLPSTRCRGVSALRRSRPRSTSHPGAPRVRRRSAALSCTMFSLGACKYNSFAFCGVAGEDLIESSSARRWNFLLLVILISKRVFCR